MKRLNLRFFISVLLLIVFSFACFSVLAQDGSASTPPADQGVNPWSLLIGSGITIAVAFLKKISFVRDNPKLVATVLSVAITAVQAIAGARAGSGVWPFVATVLAQLGAAIGTHEVVVNTLTSAR